MKKNGRTQKKIVVQGQLWQSSVVDPHTFTRFKEVLNCFLNREVESGHFALPERQRHPIAKQQISLHFVFVVSSLTKCRSSA